MAVDITLLNSNSLNNISDNFQRVKTALTEVVGREGDTPNNMNTDFDMNDNDILNVNDIRVKNLLINNVPVVPVGVGNLIIDGDKGDITVSSLASVFTIDAGVVDTNKLANTAVTTAKIMDGNVTTVKLADNSVTTAKIPDGSITQAKLGFTIVTGVFATKALAAAFSPTVAPDFLRIEGYSAAGDRGGFLAKKASPNSNPGHNASFSITLQNASVVWYVIAPEDVVAPQMFGAVTTSSDTVAVANKTAIEQCFAFAYANNIPIEFRGNYTVTNIYLQDIFGLHIVGRGGLVGHSSGSYGYLWEVKGAQSWQMSGDISLNGNGNANYTAAFNPWMTITSSTSYNRWRFGAIVNIKRAVEVGKLAQPDVAISENILEIGNLYNVPQAIVAIGAQCVLDVVNSQLVVTSGTWAVPVFICQAFGATVTFTNGEAVKTADTAGFAFHSQPVPSTAFAGFENPYGKIKISNMVTEISSQFFTTANPNAYTPTTQGGLWADHCTGVHTQNLAHFIETDAGFAGKINVKDNNWFTSGITRTFTNIYVNNSNVDIYTDEASWGAGFQHGHGGVVNGTLHFENTLITDAYDNGANTGTINGTVTCIFNIENNAGDLARWVGLYNNSTGVWTAPVGGLEDVHINFRQQVSTACTLEIRLNNSIIAKSTWTAAANAFLDTKLKTVSAGDTITCHVTATTTGVKDGGILSGMKITARKR